MRAPKQMALVELLTFEPQPSNVLARTLWGNDPRRGQNLRYLVHILRRSGVRIRSDYGLGYCLEEDQ